MLPVRVLFVGTDGKPVNTPAAGLNVETARRLAALAKGFPLPVELAISTGDATLGAQACAYFACSEGLANVTKYASASAVTISVRSEAGSLVVEVQDDGVGGADHHRGTGLRGLADRVETLGGTLTVRNPPGEGTRLVAVIPAGAA